MKCKYCGQIIPEGEMYCRRCGREVRIVPDYNPLDEVLAAQVKGSIHRSDSEKQKPYPSKKGLQTEQMQKKKQMERKKALQRKRRRKALLLLFLLLLLAGILIFFIYQNSYANKLSKGNRALELGDYDAAAACFKDAIQKKPKMPDAYTGLSRVYLAQDDPSAAEKIFLDAIGSYPENAGIYEACIQFYLDADLAFKIPGLLEDAPNAVRGKLEGYIVSPPEFSLDDTPTYDDVQQLSLTAKEGEIYYTTDGSDPVFSGILYTEPIQIGEGNTVVTAAVVNEKGIPSQSVSAEYIVELPIEDPPAVIPSTGQYDTAMQITVNVPDGYTAYYTMDRSDPTEESTLYTGPVDMPAGSTIFKAVLIDGKGRKSGITTRNYELALPGTSQQ